MTRKILFLVFLANWVFSLPSYAAEELKERLERVLAPFVTIEYTSEKITFLYCPEKPCSPIEAPRKIDNKIFYEYVLLYLFKKSHLPEFQEYGYKMPSKLSPRDEFEKDIIEIESKYRMCCASEYSPPNTTLLEYLGEKHKIKLSKSIVEDA
jgi:hypothetical protein